MIPITRQKMVRHQVLVEVDAPISYKTKSVVAEVDYIVRTHLILPMRHHASGNFTKITAFTRKNQPLTLRERFKILVKGEL